MSILGKKYSKTKPLTARLSHRIRVEEAISSKDAIGGEVKAWQEVTTVWAEILPKSANESFDSGRLESKADYVITIRYHTNIDETMRLVIVETGETLNIISVINPNEADIILEIKAKKGGIA